MNSTANGVENGTRNQGHDLRPLRGRREKAIQHVDANARVDIDLGTKIVRLLSAQEPTDYISAIQQAGYSATVHSDVLSRRTSVTLTHVVASSLQMRHDAPRQESKWCQHGIKKERQDERSTWRRRALSSTDF